MRIRSMTPIRVDDAELARRQRRYDRLAPQGWTIHLENLPAEHGTPSQLGTSDHIRASERAIISGAEHTDKDKFDAFLPDCVLDPGVRTLDSNTGVPVLALTRLSANFLASFGQKFGVITRNQAIGDEYRDLIESYGLLGSFDDVYVLGLSVDDISDDIKWNAAIEKVAEQALSRGTRILINGCSAVEVTVGDDHAVRIVDPTALALRVAELASRLDLLPIANQK